MVGDSGRAPDDPALPAPAAAMDDDASVSPSPSPEEGEDFHDAENGDDVDDVDDVDDDEFHDAENGGYGVVAEVDDGSFPDGTEDDNNNVDDCNFNADRSSALLHPL
jgi:hypothetical protein